MESNELMQPGGISTEIGGDPVTHEINALEGKIASLLAELPPKHREMARLVAEGQSQTQAALKLGYAKASAQRRSSEIYQNPAMRQVTDLLRERYCLEHGRPLRWKRRHMEKALYRGHQEENHSRAATSIDKVMRTILELDGHIHSKSENQGNITIKIATGIDTEGFVVDAEPDAGND